MTPQVPSTLTEDGRYPPVGPALRDIHHGCRQEEADRPLQDLVTGDAETPSDDLVLGFFSGIRRRWSLIAFGIVVILIETASRIPVGGLDVRLLLGAFFSYFTAFQHGVEPFYPGQHVLSLFSHAFLHHGMIHAGLNMMVLLAVGAPVLTYLHVLSARRGGWRILPGFFWIVFFLGAAAGAYATGVRNPQAVLMGASAGCAAIVGMWIVLEGRMRRALGVAPGRFRRILLEMAVVNTALPFIPVMFPNAVPFNVAWEAHLAGLVLGLVAASLIRPDPAPEFRASHRDG